MGAVERTEQRRMFAESVQDRSEPTLTALIRRHIHPGSIILSDCWAGYSTNILEGLGYEHYTVNHSQTFVNPLDGTHTNTIEGTWAGIKGKINKRHRTREWVRGGLLKFIWKRQYHDQLWRRLLEAMRTVEYADPPDEAAAPVAIQPAEYDAEL